MRAVALFALLVLGITGCTGSSTHAVAPDFPKPPSYAELVARAHLDPCPATSATKAAKSLPDLTLPCLGSGPAVHLAGLVGKPTVVNIWGSWCGPCQAETRYLSTVYDEAKAKVRFLGIDTEDDPKSALDFAPHVSPPMQYPQVVDKDKRVLIALKIPSGVPSSVFVDGAGRVVHISPGAYHSADALRADLRRYLGVTA